ncbi:hypothetical protein [Kitasatospora sp. NPDC085464]|uniref:hypothetical protein n=1 Tax=Kitasatospora sp. NPDC085464 TaxID=3364063 RepID=UPI0037C96051
MTEPTVSAVTPHELVTVAGGRLRCSECRATWTNRAAADAHGGQGRCPGHPLCHGALYDRLHYVQTRWDGLTTDALCDSHTCPVCRAWPACDCCVCRGVLTVVALHTVYEDPVHGFTDDPFLHLKETKTHMSDDPKTTIVLPGPFCDWFEGTTAYQDTASEGQDAIDFKTVYGGGRRRTHGKGYTLTISISRYELKFLEEFAETFAMLCGEGSESTAAERRANDTLQERLEEVREVLGVPGQEQQ